MAESQSVTTTANTPTDITLRASDPDGNALTYTIVSEPKSGEILGFDDVTGALVYTPTDGLTGKDGLTFRASDGTADSNTAQVTMTVNENQDSTRENSSDTELQEIPRTSENNTINSD